MRHLACAFVLAGLLLAVGAAAVSADPGSNNPKALYRTFACSSRSQAVGSRLLLSAPCLSLLA